VNTDVIVHRDRRRSPDAAVAVADTVAVRPDPA
jgi:hypothetical protein